MTKGKLVEYLDDYLKIDSVKDRSQNGLQVDGAATVEKVAVAVDACLDTIREAGSWGADMLIVHHGLFWGREERITGVMYQRIAALVGSETCLYAAHLPLDCHPEVGNNVELVRLLGLRGETPFAEYGGVDIGFIATPAGNLSRDELVDKVSDVLGSKAEVLPFGPEKVERIGVISGSAADYAAEAREHGCDTLLTGETSHVAYHLAKEAQINLVYAGHYASETVGVKALGEHLSKQFSLKCEFIAAPTGY